MGLPANCFVAVLVFCAIKEAVPAHNPSTEEDDSAKIEDAIVYAEVTLSLQSLGKIYNTLVGNHETTRQNLQDTKNNASNQATYTKLAVDRSFNIISAAAALVANKSQACADTQVTKKAAIVSSTDKDIKKALSAFDQLKPIEIELNAIESRLDQNSARANIGRLLKCKENVTVTSVSIANITKCYRQIQQILVSYIQTETKMIREQTSVVVNASKAMNLLPVFDKIIMKAVVKAKSDVEDFRVLCKRSNVVRTELKKLEYESQNKINLKINRLIDLLNKINSSVSNQEVDLDAVLRTYLAPLVSLLNSTLQQFPNGTDIFARDELVLPEVKAEILKNVTAEANAFVGNNASIISNELFAIIDNLNDSVTDDYVRTKCDQYAEQESYNSCVTRVIADLREVINNADKTFDSLFSSAAKLNESLNAIISVKLKAPLDKLYNRTITRVIDLFTLALGSGLNEINFALFSTYNDANKKVDELHKTTAVVIDNTFNSIKGALDLAWKLNLSINYVQVYPDLETLKQKIKENLAMHIGNASQNGSDLQTQIPISIDPSKIDSALKNCTSKENNFELAISNCIRPIITDFNELLKSELTPVNNSRQNVSSFIVRIEKDLNQFANNVTVVAYEVIRKASKESGTPAVVQKLEKNVFSNRDDIQEVLDKINTELGQVKQLTLSSIKDVQNKIDKALAPLALAIDITLRLNPQANLTQQRTLLENLRNNMKSKTNASISDIIRQYDVVIEDLTQQYLGLNSAYKTKIAELNETTINNTCKKQIIGEAAFIVCVDVIIITEYNNNLNIVTKKIKDLYTVIKSLTGSMDVNITSKVIYDLKPFVVTSDVASSEILHNYNVTNVEMVEVFLDKIKHYNTSNIRGIISKLTSTAEEIDKRTLATKNEANNTLYISGTAINDIVGIGRSLCGIKSVDELFKESADMIGGISNVALATAPNLTAVSNYLLLLAKYLNNTLNYEQALLGKDILNITCPTSLIDIGKVKGYYKCVLIQIDNFELYYKGESGLLKYYENVASDKLIKSTATLKKWNSDFMVPKYAEISAKAKQSAEDFYKKCNVTFEQIINYSLGVAKNHNTNFESRISTSMTDINDLAATVSGKDYSSSTPDIRPKLQAAVTSLDTAIAVALNSSNSSIITEDIKRAAENLINDGVRSMSAYVSNISMQSSNTVQQAAALLQTREELQKNYNFTFLYASCHNQSSFVEMSGCTNLQVYRNIFLAANMNIFNSLLALKQLLQNLDSNYATLIAAQADYIVNEQKKSGYYLAYRIYKAAGLPVPKDVASAVDANRCAQPLKLISQFVCAIVV